MTLVQIKVKHLLEIGLAIMRVDLRERASWLVAFVDTIVMIAADVTTSRKILAVSLLVSSLVLLLPFWYCSYCFVSCCCRDGGVVAGPLFLFAVLYLVQGLSAFRRNGLHFWRQRPLSTILCRLLRWVILRWSLQRFGLFQIWLQITWLVKQEMRGDLPELKRDVWQEALVLLIVWDGSCG